MAWPSCQQVSAHLHGDIPYNGFVMGLTTGNAITIEVDGRTIQTLRDILPESPGLKILFVGKTPAPESVQKGHYFQGAHGRLFWKSLKQYGILKPTTEFEDDSLLQQGYGLTDIAKIPRPFGHEPSPDEYRRGTERILQVIQLHQPKVVVFVYKRVLDRAIQLAFGLTKKSKYGFNRDLERHFGCKVFAFPLPGTPCTRDEIKAGMQALADTCTELEGA